ncbi:hypothetical protein ES332_D09G095700v1 [Gossypium tomentosum]|uniref:Uncharacterized protein n=1 Tax=Gossypium tomentosum TaxID=34277 RepID=A0A5D2JFN9_GOSTO|nr:hypothetical protein ES332_D09G095700v1 [Gossypium tomentosum]
MFKVRILGGLGLTPFLTKRGEGMVFGIYFRHVYKHGKIHLWYFLQVTFGASARICMIWIKTFFFKCFPGQCKNL